jgi:hypothetical protein
MKGFVNKVWSMIEHGIKVIASRLYIMLWEEDKLIVYVMNVYIINLTRTKLIH